MLTFFRAGGEFQSCRSGTRNPVHCDLFFSTLPTIRHSVSAQSVLAQLDSADRRLPTSGRLTEALQILGQLIWNGKRARPGSAVFETAAKDKSALFDVSQPEVSLRMILLKIHA